MGLSKAELTERLRLPQFPRSAEYDPQWVLDNQMGPNVLWLTEWLCECMDLKPGMRVLDMGCGMALSSVFLAKEYGVSVWANDLWIKPTENWERIREAALEDRIFPIHAEARSLPYAEGFFDAVVSMDAYHYFGTGDLYLNYFIKFLKVGGRLGIVVPGLVKDFEDGVPEHLSRVRDDGSAFWAEDCWSFHTVEWWQHLWGRSSLVDVESAGLLADGWRIWLDWERTLAEAGANRFPPDDDVLEVDGGRYMGFVRMVATRTA